MDEPAESRARQLVRLRHDAGMTQRDLAARCGVSVRTIRSLERDVAVAPRFDSVRRVVGALAASAAEQEALIAQWGFRDALLERRLDDLIERQHGDAQALSAVREQAQFSRLVVSMRTAAVGPNRQIMREDVDRVQRCTRDGADGTFLVWVSASVNEPLPALDLVELRGCSVRRTFRFVEHGVVYFDLGFGRKLRDGETHSYRYSVVFAEQSTRSPRTYGSTGDGFAGRAVLSATRVCFDRSALPRRQAQVFRQTMGAREREVRPLVLSPLREVQSVIENVPPGLHGVAWHW